jgi:putative tricarboxylic transport membrane protein
VGRKVGGGLVESILVIVLAGLGIADAWRLSGALRGGAKFHDVIGPDRYLAAISVGLLICGIWQLAGGLKGQGSTTGKKKEGDSHTGMIVLVIFVLILYSVLLPVLGYLIGTLLFFPIVFFIFGVRSWVKSLIVGLLTAVIFYAIFEHFAELSLPKGFLEGLL